jgi:hypothetical protein
MTIKRHDVWDGARDVVVISMDLAVCPVEELAVVMLGVVNALLSQAIFQKDIPALD